jgi:CheY-like chemotaxis protein
MGHWAMQHVLVVDETFDSCWSIVGWLSMFLRDVTVESAISASEALEAIELRHPDLVLTAHRMIESDGIELARRLKLQPNAPIVVVMTEHADAGFEAACAAAGADFCLEKRQLQARLLVFLRQHFRVSSERRAII